MSQDKKELNLKWFIEKIFIPVLCVLIAAYVSLAVAKLLPWPFSTLPTATPTLIVSPSTLTPSPIPPTSTPTFSLKYQPPVILYTKNRISTTIDGLIYTDIYFRDPDGDSYAVTYEAVGTPIPGLQIGNDLITKSASDQIDEHFKR